MSSRRDSSSRSCANCNSRSAEKGRSDNLCSKCAHKLPRTQCHYCRITYHQLARHAHLPPHQRLCTSCASDQELYGAPALCSLCRFQAAFDGVSLCRHCTSDSKRFGAALPCNHCGFLCAFERDAESKAKVDGLTLCFLCTHQYKTLKKKQEKEWGATSAEALKATFAAAPAEKRPREEELESAGATAGGSNSGGGGKRARFDHAPSPSPAVSASPSLLASASPSPSPAAAAAASSSSSLGGSSFSLSSPMLGSTAAAAASSPLLNPSSVSDLYARVQRLEQENASLLRSKESMQQKLLVSAAKMSEALRAAEDARAAALAKEKECNQLRGELEAAKRALGVKKDTIAAQLHKEALRSLNQAPNPNHVKAAAAAAAAAEDGEDGADLKM